MKPLFIKVQNPNDETFSSINVRAIASVTDIYGIHGNCQISTFGGGFINTSETYEEVIKKIEQVWE